MSLFDPPREHLLPAIFTPDDKMRPDFRIYILTDLQHIMDTSIISYIYMLGSSAGRQYNDESDIDIDIVLKKGFSREDYKEYLKKYSGRFLPGTKHPISYHVQDYSEPHFQDAEYAIYDLLSGDWVVPPKKLKDIRDPHKEFEEELRYAKFYSDIYKYRHNDQYLHDLLEQRRKNAYSTGWGTPRDSQQNILYKYITKFIKPDTSG